MRNKKAKKLRKAVREGFGDLNAAYKEVNRHYKSYGLDPITQEPMIQLVSTIRLSNDCGRFAYQALKVASK